jgi:hypothetical protein
MLSPPHWPPRLSKRWRRLPEHLPLRSCGTRPALRFSEALSEESQQRRCETQANADSKMSVLLGGREC